MKDKTRATLFGSLIGAGLIVFIELLDVWLSDGGFFDTWWSWLLLAISIVLWAFFNRRDYDRKKGLYRDDLADDADAQQTEN